MKKISLMFVLWCIIYTSWCTLTEDKVEHSTESSLVLSIPETFTWAYEADPLTVNGIPIQLETKKILSGAILVDIQLDRRADYFDQVEKDSISNYSWYKLIETVPSLDTPVCTRQTKQLESAAKLFSDISFIVISNDTPFALQRFCLANNIDNIHILSDARTREFGKKNGLFMPEYGLLARSIMIVDNEMNVLYIDYAEEITEELDIINALAYLQHITNKNK